MSYDYQANFTGSPLTNTIHHSQVGANSTVSPLVNNVQYTQGGTDQTGSHITNNLQFTPVGTPSSNIQYTQVGTPTSNIQYTQVGTPINQAVSYVSYVNVPPVNGGLYSPINTGVQVVSPLMSNIYYFGSVSTPYNFDGSILSFDGQNMASIQTEVQTEIQSNADNVSTMSNDLSKKYTMVGYNSSPPTKPCGRDNKAGWYGIHDKHVLIASQRQANVILCGDSIIAGLSRYSMVWNKHFKPLNAVNCGIGGDRTQHVLWRMENMKLPSTVKYIVIHCGTNNIDRDSAQDIANGVISCGLVLQEGNPELNVVVTGLLPRDLENSRRRHKINQTNKFLKKYCRQFSNFSYMKQDDDWVLENGLLNQQFYYSDYLHLVESGNDKFATSIINILNRLSRNENIDYSSDEDVDVSFKRITSEVRLSTPNEDTALEIPLETTTVKSIGGKKKGKRYYPMESHDGTTSMRKRKRTNDDITSGIESANGDVCSSEISITPTKPCNDIEQKRVKKDYFSLNDMPQIFDEKVNESQLLNEATVLQVDAVEKTPTTTFLLPREETLPVTELEGTSSSNIDSSLRNKLQKSQSRKNTNISAPSALVLKIKKSMEQARKELSKKKLEVSLQGYDSHGDSSQGESTPPKLGMRKLISDYGSGSDSE